VRIARFHTSTPLNLFKPASNCCTDRRISSMFVAEIVLHCYNGFAFGQPNDSLYFVLQASICRLIAALAVLTTAESVSRMRLKYAPNDVFRKRCELMNTLQKTPSRCLFSHGSYYSSKLGPSFSMKFLSRAKETSSPVQGPNFSCCVGQ
jgi:hypothetical protein